MGRRLAKLIGPIERALWDRSPVILIYHRVAPQMDDLWGIAVEPDRFAEQIDALKQVRDVVSLDQVLAWMAHGRPSERPLAAVTFDDGYHDALTTAQPILEQRDCPATVYVATGPVESGSAYWWDELVRIVMEAPSHGPPLQLQINNRSIAWLAAGDRGGRQRVCRQIRRRLRDLPPSEIDIHLDAICAWAGAERGVRPQDRPMTAEEVGKLSGHLVTIGAHTARHPSLPTLSGPEQLAEMNESRRACEAWTGGPVLHFAYPFGHYDRLGVQAARTAGFRSACATTPGVVRPWTDPLCLPRITPGRMDGEALTRLLS
ncbi:MAG TPA: polysaccharide deacetylase family protein [Caulobacteraceae bacterium]